mmetsp:Transcript_63572/g.98977  ORF Transcript_63572/g.98977 Transcript_63572/m.98977 type:complete len:581 (-) Transcript_63572:77-1819(-)
MRTSSSDDELLMAVARSSIVSGNDELLTAVSDVQAYPWCETRSSPVRENLPQHVSEPLQLEPRRAQEIAPTPPTGYPQQRLNGSPPRGYPQQELHSPPLTGSPQHEEMAPTPPTGYPQQRFRSSPPIGYPQQELHSSPLIDSPQKDTHALPCKCNGSVSRDGALTESPNLVDVIYGYETRVKHLEGELRRAQSQVVELAEVVVNCMTNKQQGSSPSTPNSPRKVNKAEVLTPPRSRSSPSIHEPSQRPQRGFGGADRGLMPSSRQIDETPRPRKAATPKRPTSRDRDMLDWRQSRQRSDFEMSSSSSGCGVSVSKDVFRLFGVLEQQCRANPGQGKRGVQGAAKSEERALRFERPTSSSGTRKDDSRSSPRARRKACSIRYGHEERSPDAKQACRLESNCRASSLPNTGCSRASLPSQGFRTSVAQNVQRSPSPLRTRGLVNGSASNYQSQPSSPRLQGPEIVAGRASAFSAGHLSVRCVTPTTGALDNVAVPAKLHVVTSQPEFTGSSPSSKSSLRLGTSTPVRMQEGAVVRKVLPTHYVRASPLGSYSPPIGTGAVVVQQQATPLGLVVRSQSPARPA